jgi:choline dehydrogenase-like flavoprotein
VKNNKVTELVINGTKFDVGENQKVILCAGTVNTAAIALRSEGLSDSVRKKIGKNLTDHEVGTIRMDGPSNSNGVVDSNLKVKDVDNLYVCDLSVFPCSPMENPSLILTALAMGLAAHLKNRKG